ncbi:MAG: hypothetical protein WB996_08705 [Ignavibacteriaceae bacterium]
MNEKIFRYAEGEMTPEEKAQFEKELKASEVLMAELENYKNLLSEVVDLRAVESDERYFSNLIPEFRNNLEKKKKRSYHPALSFASAVVTVMILFFILPINNKNIDDYVNNIPDSAISEYLNNYGDQQLMSNIPDDYVASYDSIADAMLYSQIRAELGTDVQASVYNNIDYNSLVETINPQEADQIYAEMINKKIF